MRSRAQPAGYVALVSEVARELANPRAWPGWNAGSEFEAVRDASRHERPALR